MARRLASVKDLWPPRAIPTAIFLVLGALAFLLGWRLGDIDHLDAWAPNIVVGLVVLAVTITFVEWIIQRESNPQAFARHNCFSVASFDALVIYAESVQV
jgi:protein-S-isoprenylcysteine O-methyltransferase Ste14